MSTEAAWGRKGLFGLHVPVISPKKARGGTQSRNPEAGIEAQTNGDGLHRLLSYATQDHLPEITPHTMGLALLTSTTNKENTLQACPLFFF